MLNLLESLKNQDKIKAQIKILQDELTNPSVYHDKNKLQKISRDLQKAKEKFKILEKMISNFQRIEINKAAIKDETDKELIELFQDENKALREEISQLEKKLVEIDTQKEEDNSTSVIIEIRAGTGGEESNLFVKEIFRMYTKFAEKNGWKVVLISKNQTGIGGFKEISAEIFGENVYKFLKNESGVHRVQRIPETEKSGRIHTSAVSVVVYPHFENISEIDIKNEEIKIDVYRSAGAGGQSVNTADSAVRITHLPTGIVVTCQDERSQLKNKKKAMSILKSKLLMIEKEKKEIELAKTRKNAIKTGDRSDKIRTYNFPQDRVTDHRFKKSWHNLKSIMEGNIEEMINAGKF